MVAKWWQFDKIFHSNRGLYEHQQNNKTNTLDELETTNERDETTEVTPKTTISATSGAPQRTTYTWRKYPSRIFEMNAPIIYEKNVYWKINAFPLTSGQAGKIHHDDYA